ncbi:FkbM family methyltransferase [Luteimonas lutimaris]|uniref:FkbM family methyltransferase n=1 Tax=Luteimonas lutimaris TaxID=698645 RepID=UPI0031D8B5C8
MARNAVHASSWNGVRIALQATSLVLMARVLGANGYGALAGTVALFMVCGQLTGLGSGLVLLREVARGDNLRDRLAATQRTYLLSGVILTLVALPVSQFFLGTQVPLQAMTLLAIAEILVAPALQPLVFRYQAEERLFLSSAIGTLAPMARLGAIATAAILGRNEIVAFAQLYLTWLVPAVAITTYRAMPRGDVSRHIGTRQCIREGLPYVFSGAALTAGRELDKTVLLRIAGDTITGAYSAAHRIASAAMLPVNALILAATPRLFRASPMNDGRLPRAMLLVVLGYSTLASAALWLLSPFAPILLGHDFSDSAPLLRAFCLTIITGSLRQYVSGLLTTRDMQITRNAIELGGVVVSLLLLVFLVPEHGAYGAVFAVAGSDFCVTVFGACKIMRNRDGKNQSEPAGIRKFLQGILEYTGPGRWIYTRQVLSWTDDALLVDQLPPRLRIFCRYVNAYNRLVGTRTILFARRLYGMLKITAKTPNQTRVEINGFGVWIDLTDPGSLNAINEIRNGSSVSKEIRSLCSGADAFIDIGGNQGAMTAIACQSLPGDARIIVVEPQPNLVACIRRTLEEHRPRGNWEVIQSAVGRWPSTTQIIVPSENFGQAHVTGIDEKSPGNATTVDVVSIDSLLHLIDPGSRVVMKMDIEGYEFDALAGARELASRFKPTLILEVNETAMSRYHRTIDALGKLLHDLGYTSWRECGNEHQSDPVQALVGGYCDIVLQMEGPGHQ